MNWFALPAMLLAMQTASEQAGVHSAPARDREAAEHAAEVVLPEELRWALDEVATLTAEGNLDAARGLLREVANGESYRALLELEPEVVWRGLSEIDRSAESLSLLPILSRVREEQHARLSLGGNPDRPELLAAKQKLAATRLALGDFAGAKELFEQVHAARERLLPADHPDLLTAKLNLAATRYKEGDLAGTLELVEHVHAVRERLLPADHPDLLHAKLNLAATRNELGDVAGARELFEQVVAVRERLLPADHPDLLTAKLNLAVTRGALGDLAGALELEEYVHAARERLLPADHPDLLAAKQHLAATRKRLGDLAGALSLEEQVLAACARLLPPDHPDLLNAQLNLAATRYELGDLSEAHELFEHVHAARARLLPADHPALLDVELNLAVTRSALGDLAGAQELLEHVRAVRARLLPPDHPDLLAAEQNLAATRSALGDLAGARELLEHVHAARARFLPPDHPDRLAAELNLAVTRYELGDLAGALKLLEHVHAARERLLPVDHPDLLAVKLNLAAVRQALGDLAGAQELFATVCAARERLLPADHPALLDAKLGLAVARKAAGDLTGALELEEHVHAARERLLAADHPALLLAKQNLAGTRLELGDLHGALVLFEQVHTARERLLSVDHPDLLAAKLNLARTRRALGDLEGALELDQYVHAARQRLLPADHPALLLAKQNLAATRYALGDLGGALELFEQVHAARERLLPADHPDLLATKLNLAAVRYARGDLAGTLQMSRSFLASELLRAASLRSEAPRVARSNALGELRRFSAVLCFREAATPAARGRLDELCFSVLESLRMVSTSSSEVALALARFPEFGELQARLAEVRSELNDMTFAAPEEPATLEAWRESLVALADARDRLERELRIELAAKGLVTNMPTSEGVARGLEQGSALIGFFRYLRQFEPDPETGAYPPAVDSLLAFVVTPDARVHRVELGASAELERLTHEWRGLLGKPIERGVGVVSSGEPPDEAQTGQILRERLLDPCFAVIGDEPPASVHVILDDFLHLLPLDALPWKNGQRLGEGLAVRLEVSALRLMSPQDTAPERGTLVALGGMDFGAEHVAAPSSRLSTATGRFEPLLQTRFEVEALGRQYEELVGGKPVVLTKSAASKQALVELASEARWLHVATHAWFAPETFASMLDGLEVQGAQGASLARAEDTVRGFAPETLCGLALAGANHGRNELGHVPGIMTAEELATLDLSNCELAVLSACETNVGLRRAGQGIQSLQSALHAAGARTAITSLWQVDDAATRRLFELFYTRLWREGLGKADALWQAKMALREEGHALRDWAGWVLSGDPN